ncbi:hypothetical protein PRIPAC_82902, partial [Pristionchus pacificus]
RTSFRSMSGPPSTSTASGGRTVASTVDINIESVTGQRWVERMLLAESVYDLKERIWRRTKLPPMKQALIYTGALLSSDSVSLSSVGVRGGSTLKLVLVTRTGPVQEQSHEARRRAAAAAPPPRMSAEEATSQSDREGTNGSSSLRRGGRSSTRSSAPEDTSAKESSDGEEREEEEQGREAGERRLSESLGSCSGRTAARKQRTLSQCTVVGGGGGSTIGQSMEHNDDRRAERERAQSASTASAAAAQTTVQLAANSLLQLRQDENEEPHGDVSREPDDLSLSEMSSGVIICDLSNEFRKLKVKRRHHTSSGPAVGVNGGMGGRNVPPLSARRARSKPRATAAVSHEATSSDDESHERTDSSPNGAPAAAAWSCSTAAAVAASSRRAAQAVRQPRHMNSRQMLARCAVCAGKLQSAFVCRCGKALCGRHRASALHGCSKSAAAAASTRSRPIAAQFSD